MFRIADSKPREPLMERSLERTVDKGPPTVAKPHPIAVLKIRLGKMSGLTGLKGMEK